MGNWNVKEVNCEIKGMEIAATFRKGNLGMCVQDRLEG